MTAQAPTSKVKKHKAIRALLIVAGSISLALGAVGIFLPVLPTTPFLLLSAACYMRSSERLLNWLLNNRWFGQYIKNYQEGKGIPKKTKIIALSFLWITILYSTCFVVDEILIAQVALLLVAAGVSIHLIRTPTFKSKPS
jgi:uncharacterized membrane protein YbaN (DUF454 family)